MAEDPDAVDAALEEAFEQEDANEVHNEPEIKLPPQVWPFLPSYLIDNDDDDDKK